MNSEIACYRARLQDGSETEIGFGFVWENPNNTYENSIKLADRVSVWEDNSWVDLGFSSIGELSPKGGKPTIKGGGTPTIEGTIDMKENQLRILHVNRGCITGGQEFLFKTLSQIISHNQEIRVIRFRSVDHQPTLTMIKKLIDSGKQEIVPTRDSGPLISALSKLGCKKIEAVNESNDGNSYYYEIKGWIR